MSKLITKAVEALKNDEFIVYPTDTLYGLGINLTKKENYDKLIELKQRTTKPNVLSMFSSIEQVEKFVELTEKEKEIILKNKDRGFSFIINKPVLKTLYSGENYKNTLRFRVTNQPAVKEIIEKCRFPISSTSVNLSGEKPAFSIDQVNDEIKKNVEVIIDVGKLKGASSTLIDISEKQILRQGQNDPLW